MMLLWWRAFSIVTLTALNVVLITNGAYLAAFVSGGLLSYVWWGNTRQAAHTNTWYSQYIYTFGAGCGTVVGMWLGRLLR